MAPAVFRSNQQTVFEKVPDVPGSQVINLTPVGVFDHPAKIYAGKPVAEVEVPVQRASLNLKVAEIPFQDVL